MKTPEQMRKIAAQGRKKADAENHKNFLAEEKKRKTEEHNMNASIKELIPEIIKSMEKELRKTGKHTYTYSDVGRTNFTLYHRTAEELRKIGYDASAEVYTYGYWVGDTESACYEESTKYCIIVTLPYLSAKM